MTSDDRKKIIQEYLIQDNLKKNDKKIIINLYLLSVKLDKYLKTLNKNKKEVLTNLENEIYNIDGKYLDDSSKIKLEIIYYKNLKNEIINKYLKEIKDIIKKNKDNLEENNIETIKEKIVQMQILTNNEITFYNSSYCLLDKYLSELKEKMELVWENI